MFIYVNLNHDDFKKEMNIVANVVVSVPDGDYCSDKNYLGCKFCQSDGQGFNYCIICEKPLGSLETFEVEGQVIRARRKCRDCFENIKEDFGKGYNKPSSL